MKSNKKYIIILLVGMIVSAEEIKIGKLIKAKFRRHDLSDKAEDCDFVMGDVIPKCYQDKPVLDEQDVATFLETGEWPEYEEEGGDEVELTMDTLNGLTVKELKQLAEDNEVPLEPEDRKNKDNLISALADHFEIVV
jgi:hypothetical protein